MATPFRALLVPIACLGALALSGCGNSGPKTIPVQGKITYRGKPVEKVEVQFTPVSAEGSSLKRIATAEIESEGQYTLGTFANGDGALPGDYIVTVTRLKRKSSIDGPTASSGAQTSAVPAIYSRQETSPLKATVPAEASSAVTLDFELIDQ